MSTLLAVLAGVFAVSAAPSASVQSLSYQYVPFAQLDPQRISDGEPVAGQNLLEGLVVPNAAGTGVVPATADRWTKSRGRTVYTFHIRGGASWSDGSPVTAHDFEWTYKRLLTPSTSALDHLYGGSSYPADLGIRNATAFQLGRIANWSQVGVQALGASTLRITLAAPNPGFLQEMALPAMVALPQKNLTRFPFDWQTVAHWVGNGPFTIDSWTPNSDMRLVPNAHYWDRKHVRLDRVTITVASSTDDKLRSRYKQHQLDVAKIGDLRAFTGDPVTAQAVTRLRTFSVIFLGLVPSRSPTLRDARVRQALALAMDHVAVSAVNPLLVPTTSLVPSTLPGFDGSVGFKANVAKARHLLAAAGYPGGRGFPTLSVITSHNDPFVQAALDALHRSLHIRAVQQIESADLAAAKEHELQPRSFTGFFSTGYTAILSWRAWVSGTYPPTQTELLSLTPDNYLRYLVLQAKGTAKALAKATAFLATHASPQSKRFAALTAQADATADPARATALYKRAAAARQSTYEFIPFAAAGAAYIVRPGINGIHIWPGYFTISFKGVTIG